MDIIYWSDYACPYCYIGEARLKKAIKQLNSDEPVSVQMKAFQLDPTAGEHAESDTVTRFAKKYGLSKEAAADRIKHISQLGIGEGIDFKYATTLFTNTMDAHRLTKLAESKKNPELTDKVIERLFAAYFTDNLELANHDLLRKIGVECGLDEAEVNEVLSTDKFRDEVEDDEYSAASYGIHSVPFFIINGKYAIPGAQSTRDMLSSLRQVQNEERIKAAAQSGGGMSCGPDGCRIEDHK